MPDLILEIANIRTTLRASPNFRALVHTWLSARPPNFQFDRRYKRRTWDGYVRFLSANNTFPTGLVPHVVKRAKEIGVTYKLVDKRSTTPTWNARPLRGVTLRDYQQAGVDAVQDTTLHGLDWPRGVIAVPTGGGKTEMIAALAGGYGRELVLVLVHRKVLLHQTAERLRTRLGEKIGKIGDGKGSIERVTVAMVGSMANRIHELAPYLVKVRVLLIDECHRLGAKTYNRTVSKIPAYVRVGFSATPFKQRNPVHVMGVCGPTGNELYRIPSKALRAAGHVVPVTMHYALIDKPQRVKGLPTWTLPWMPKYVTVKGKKQLVTPSAYEELVVRNPYRNARIDQFVRSRTSPTLVTVTRIEHGQLLADILSDVPGCIFVDGTESSDLRARVLGDLAAGRRQVVIATIFDEGVDVPVLENLVLAGGGKSEIQLLQRIGRGVRTAHGKVRLTVLDFYDVRNQHTAKHSRERIQTAQAEGFDVDLHEVEEEAA